MELQKQYFHQKYAPSINRRPGGHKLHKKNKEKLSNENLQDDEENLEERKKRNQRYMNVLHDLSRLRDHYYSLYLAKLEAKVQKQRKELKAREEKLQKALLEKESEKVKKAHQVSHKLAKVKVTNDTEYLRQVPKSRYYHLVAVEELMKSRGLLKHKFEVEDFWKKARENQSFWIRPIPASLSPDRLTEHMLSRYSSVTTHSKTDPSIINGKPSLIQVEALPGILKKSMEFFDDELQSDERSNSPPLVFPEQPKFPKLHSFNKSLFTKSAVRVASSTSQEKNERQNPRQSRRKLAEHHMKRNAYDVAVVNTAMTGRLLKRHGAKVESLKPISEITEIWCSQSETSSQMSKSTRSKETVSRRRSKKKQLHNVAKASESIEDANNLSPIREQIDNSDVSTNEPLSMDMMIHASNVLVKDVKCQNPLWINYVNSDQELE